MVNFEWDEKKNYQNIRKHGYDFEDAWQVFGVPFTLELDLSTDYGEDRWTILGLLGDRVVVMTFAIPRSKTVRIISMRKASGHERQKFEEEI